MRDITTSVLRNGGIAKSARRALAPLLSERLTAFAAERRRAPSGLSGL